MKKEQQMECIVLIATAWGSRFGGINSFNTSLSIGIAKELMHGSVYVVVDEANSDDKEHAKKNNVNLISLSEVASYLGISKPSSQDLLSYFKRINIYPIVWIGHDVKTGQMAVECSKLYDKNAKSAVIHHMDYEAMTTLKHDNPAESKKRRWQQENLLKSADIIFAVGPKLRESAKYLIGGHEGTNVIELIPGLEAINPITKPSPKFSAIVFGRFGDNDEIIKQPRLAVAAFSQAQKESSDNLGRDPSILLYGYPDDEKIEDVLGDLRQFSSCYNSDIVRIEPLPFLNELDKENFFKELARCSVCIMPSFHEGFGLVAWEAIAAGIPVILSKNSGVYQFFEERYGKDIKKALNVINVKGNYDTETPNQEDVLALSKILCEIHSKIDEEKRFSLKLRNILIGDGYTWERTAVECLSAVGMDFIGDNDESLFLKFPSKLTKWVTIDGDGKKEYSPENIHCTIVEAPVIPNYIRSIIDIEVESMNKARKKEGKTFFDGDLFSLSGYYLNRTPNDEDMTLDLEIHKVNYPTFLGTVLSIDKKYKLIGKYGTLRRKRLAGLSPKKVDPVMANGIGVAITIFTSDDRLILQKRHHSVTARPGELDCSVVEGMNPEKDFNVDLDRFDPFIAALRGVGEEIGIYENIKLLGFGVDMEYYQWNLIGCAYSNLSWDEIIEIKSRGTEGKWEANHISVPSAPEEVLPLLFKNKMWSSGLVSIYWSLINKYGRDRVMGALFNVPE